MMCRLKGDIYYKFRKVRGFTGGAWLFIFPLLIVCTALALFIKREVKTGDMRTRGNISDLILMSLIFTLLFGVSASRIAVGNDYWVYTSIFNLISQHRYVPTEIGFNALVRGIQLLFGDDKYLVVFAFFSLGTVFFFVKAIWDRSENISWSVFLLLSSGYYFISFSNVRYYFALSIAAYACVHILKRDYTRFILWILFAALFHKSVLLVIPLYFIASLEWKKAHIIIGVILSVQFLIFRDFYKEIVFFFYPDYKNSAFDVWTVSRENLARSIAITVFSLIYYKSAINKNKENRFYFQLNICSVITYSICSFLPQTSRIAFYMTIHNIFLIPGVLKSIENKKQKIFFSAASAGAFVLWFIMFLKTSYSVDVRILPYLTWIFD